MFLKLTLWGYGLQSPLKYLIFGYLISISNRIKKWSGIMEERNLEDDARSVKQEMNN